MNMESQGSVKVRVKSASLSCEDVDVECNMSYKVKQLKELIRVKSPMHPEIADQRLIYAGHLLDDEQILREVLLGNSETSQISNASFTVHLATTLRGMGKTHQLENSKKPLSAGSSSQQQSSTTQPQVPPIRVEPTATATPRVELPNFQSSSGQTGIPPDILALHQQYVQQMMQYMMNWSQMTLGFVPPLYAPYTTNMPTTNSFVPPPPAAHHDHLHHPHHQQQQQQPVIPPPNIDVQDVRINEVANRGGDEEEAPRDFLDWMYTVVRVALIFSVVYFYSNFTRFFLVVLFTALVMVFQRRQVAHQAEAVAAAEQRQERANTPAPPPPSETAQAQTEAAATNNTQDEEGTGTSKVQSKQDTPVAGENETESAVRLNGNVSTTDEPLSGGNEDGPSSSTNTATLPETSEPRRSVRDITLTFLTTFFTSLIPQMPQNN